jgi:hypothetical protein
MTSVQARGEGLEVARGHDAGFERQLGESRALAVLGEVLHGEALNSERMCDFTPATVSTSSSAICRLVAGSARVAGDRHGRHNATSTRRWASDSVGRNDVLRAVRIAKEEIWLPLAVRLKSRLEIHGRARVRAEQVSGALHAAIVPARRSSATRR